MALIIDPDDLNQGSSTAVSDFVITTPGSGADSQFTSAGSNMPALASGEDFELRDHSDPLANGLWRVVTVNTSTMDYEVDKLSNGAVPITAASEPVVTLGATGASTEKSVYLDTLVEEIWLLEQGNLSTDGAIMLAIHSFIKEEWKTDQLLIDSGAFPMVGISFAAGQWEFGEDPSGNNSDWVLKVDVPSTTDSIRLVRNAGWEEKDNTGTVQRKYFNVTTLGAFEDTADQAYFFFGSTVRVDNTTDYAFTGVVNEPVIFYDNITPADGGTGFAFTTSNTLTRNDGGDWLTEGYVEGGQIEIANANTPANDGTFLIDTVTTGVITSASTPWTNDAADNTMTAAYDQSNAFTTSLRIRDADPEGKTFDTATLASAGETAIASKVIKFPLANTTDLDITETDANVSTIEPFTEVRLRYMDGTYNRAVDSATLRDWGVVVDVGTWSGHGMASDGTATVTVASQVLGAGEALADYTGGTLTIHDATAPDRATHTIVGTPTLPGGVLTIVLSSALTNTEADLSFTMDRATPVTGDRNEIYEKIQFQLRQATDIDETDGVIIGKMIGGLATFVGSNITFGLQLTANPNGGGAGVIVEGFDANDTNNMFFVDNGGVTRNFPFVAAGNLNFNANLTGDTAPEFFLYFQYTTRTTNADIDTSSPSGDTYTLTGTLPNLAVNDYIRISGFVQAANNGLFRVTVETTPSADYDVIRVDGENVGTVETDQTVNIDEDPFNSPGAILVDDNGGSDIVGSAATASVAFDFDYDSNTQGGTNPRTAGQDATCVLKALGLELGQYTEVLGQVITRNVGLSFTATAPLERNYDNP